MLCENCGKNYANVKYTQIINGVKKEISVCEKCSKKLGIDHLDFSMPIGFGSYLSDFFGEYENPNIFQIKEKELECPNCKTTFEEFMNSGNVGCQECYKEFKNKMDIILKNIQGANRHVGRLGKIEENPKENRAIEKQERKNNEEKNADIEINIEERENQKVKKQIEQLKKQLREAIKDERYEEAAQIRDKIKKLEQ